jgi:hypothetical protein
MNDHDRKEFVKRIRRQRELSRMYAAGGPQSLTQEENTELSTIEDDMMGYDWTEILLEEIEYLSSAGYAAPPTKRRTEKWI